MRRPTERGAARPAGHAAPTAEVEVAGLGRVLLCHGTPASDEEIVTLVTPDERLAAILEGVGGRRHRGSTHSQIDRVVGGNPLP